MRIDPMTGAYIGEGEDAAYEILAKWYGQSKVLRTVPFRNFRVVIPWGISERQRKETIDIVLKYHPWTFCVRMQDARHKGQLMPQIDAVQKAFLESIPYHKVIDIHKDDAPVLFSDVVSEESEFEMWLNFLENGVLVCPHCHVIGRNDVIDGQVFCDACGDDISMKVEFTT